MPFLPVSLAKVNVKVLRITLQDLNWPNKITHHHTIKRVPTKEEEIKIPNPKYQVITENGIAMDRSAYTDTEDIHPLYQY